MSKLALYGGTPVRGTDKPFPAYNTIGSEEEAALVRVARSGVLSKYLGAWGPDFFGGTEVKSFEREWAEHFGVRHAVAMNSATSGLIAAVGALGIGPGDEVIVSPYTMIASVSCVLWYGAIPVFADVEPEYFCLDPKSVEAALTPRTKAIIVVDLFGGPHDADAINAIAKKHGLTVIADSAQAPGAFYNGSFAGTCSTIGVYSLNYHKHIHTGEGSLVVTDDDTLAEKLQLIRNHAEAVVGPKGVTDLTNMLGFNFRLSELHAALGREQLKKLPMLITERRKNSAYIAERCADMAGFRPAPERPRCASVFYVQPFLYDEKIAGISRNRFIEAIRAELPPTLMRDETQGALIAGGYVRPIYLEPLFQKRIAIGSKGYPFTSPLYEGTIRYEKGMCPVVEKLHEKELIHHEMMRPGMSVEDLDDVIRAFHKVYEYRFEIT